MRHAALSLLLVLSISAAAAGQTRIRDICRVKGQEENTLQGVGLVVGLAGTGDADSRPTQQALATIMDLLGHRLEDAQRNADVLKQLKGSQNVALVMVTATVPASGARRGELLNCQVNSIGAKAKSLKGGYLVMTPLLGPRRGSRRVYAFAQGRLEIEDSATPTSATVPGGCRVEEDFFSPFVNQGVITLVIDKPHASFNAAHEIVELINGRPDFRELDSGSQPREVQGYANSSQAGIAQAIDSKNVLVRIPQHYRSDPVNFVAQVLDQRFHNPQKEARITINERTGTVIIDGDVEIGRVAITHKNMTIETGLASPTRFETIDTAGTATTKLKTLVSSLQALRVSTEDIIDILKGLHANGKIYGRVEFK